MPRATSPLRDRVVFLVGARRSGTNWLERILTAHPSVAAMSSETYLFSHGVAPLAERFQHANPGSSMMGQTFIDRDAFLDATRDLLDAAFTAALDRSGGEPRYVVERTPWHAQHLRLIADVYPDARVLHMLRDGRAVARSLMSMDWGPSTMAEAAAEWRDSVTGGRAGAALFGPRYREVVYEHLLADPRVRTGELFGWLGLELSDEVWERILFEAGSEFNVDPGSPQVRADKWRDELSAEDLAEFDRVAGAELASCGYAPATAASAAPAQRPRRRPGRRGLTRAVRHPRAAARPALDRMMARRARRDLHANLAVAVQFDDLVERGDDAAARDLMAPRVTVRLVDDGRRYEGRGDDAVRELLTALEQHRERGRRVLSGETHASPECFTMVTTYALDGGERWTRTLVLHVQRQRIVRVGTYRYPTAT